VFTVAITNGHIHRYFIESSEIFIAHATITDGYSVRNTDEIIPSVTFSWEFFLARSPVSNTVGVGFFYF